MNSVIQLSILTFCILWAYMGISLAVENGILFRQFRTKYPQEAERKMKEVTTGMRHPSKVLYFLNADSRRFLTSKNDRELLALRNRFVLKAWTFLSLHFGVMVVGIVSIFIVSCLQ